MWQVLSQSVKLECIVTKRLSLGGANTVDLSVMMDDTDQTLSLAGNVITTVVVIVQ